MTDQDRQTLAELYAFERRNQFWLRVIMGLALLSLALTVFDAQAQISADLDLGPLIQKLRPRKVGKVTCGIETVGYRFIGPAGRKLRYAGDTYEIEGDGDLELIADKRRKTYAVDGRSLPLDVWPRDEFGFREVPVK